MGHWAVENIWISISYSLHHFCSKLRKPHLNYTCILAFNHKAISFAKLFPEQVGIYQHLSPLKYPYNIWMLKCIFYLTHKQNIKEKMHQIWMESIKGWTACGWLMCLVHSVGSKRFYAPCGFKSSQMFSEENLWNLTPSFYSWHIVDVVRMAWPEDMGVAGLGFAFLHNVKLSTAV